jgi:hypothetical protein
MKFALRKGKKFDIGGLTGDTAARVRHPMAFASFLLLHIICFSPEILVSPQAMHVHT